MPTAGPSRSSGTLRAGDPAADPRPARPGFRVLTGLRQADGSIVAVVRGTVAADARATGPAQRTDPAERDLPAVGGRRRRRPGPPGQTRLGPGAPARPDLARTAGRRLRHPDRRPTRGSAADRRPSPTCPRPAGDCATARTRCSGGCSPASPWSWRSGWPGTSVVATWSNLVGGITSWPTGPGLTAISHGNRPGRRSSRSTRPIRDARPARTGSAPDRRASSRIASTSASSTTLWDKVIGHDARPAADRADLGLEAFLVPQGQHHQRTGLDHQHLARACRRPAPNPDLRNRSGASDPGRRPPA